MTNTLPVVQQVAHYVQSGNIAAAENALVSLADSEGDQALVAVIEAMPETDLISVLREFDSSKETVVASLLSPEKFASVIGLESRYTDPQHERLRGMINAVVLADEDRADEYLEALGNCEGGLTALRNYFSDRHAELEYLALHDRIDQSQAADYILEDELADLEAMLRDAEDIRPSRLEEHADGGWMQLAWLLRFNHTDVFAELLRLLRKTLATDQGGQHVEPVKGSPLKSALEDDPDDDDSEESAL